MDIYRYTGCGSEIQEDKRYKHGHHRKGKRFPGQKGSPRPTLRGKPTLNKGKEWSAEVKTGYNGKEWKKRLTKLSVVSCIV